MRQLLFELGVPCLLLVAFTMLFRMTDLDRELERPFFNPELAKGFDAEAQPWCFLYDYGEWPGIASTVAAGIFLVLGFFFKNLRRFRKASLFVVLLVALGPGLVVNTIFKDNWGRPRPREIKEFNGERDFLPVWTKGAPAWINGKERRGKSFPSGHAAMAFFMIFPYFLLKDRNRKAAYACLAAGLAYGVVMGVARMAQGGHFASDVVWAAGFVYLLGLALYHVLHLGGEAATADPLRTLS